MVPETPIPTQLRRMAESAAEYVRLSQEAFPDATSVNEAKLDALRGQADRLAQDCNFYQLLCEQEGA